MSAPASRIQSFDTSGFRLTDNTVPDPVVNSWNGLTGDVKGTLAEIFAFGVGDDPEADNAWAMGYGRRRFQSLNQGNGALWAVNDVFFEDHATQGDPRVGAWITVRSPGPLLSTAFHTDTVYLAGFGFLVPDTVEWVDRGIITGDLDDTHQTGASYWESRHSVSYFFGDSPVSLPSPPDEQKQVAYAFDNLWFGGNVANGVREARLLSGWGQEFLYTRPQHNGITPALIGVMTDADIAIDAAGDGSGFWLLFGDPAHEDDTRIRGMFNAHMQTADPFGAWGLDLWTYDGSAPYQIAALDHVVGLGLNRGGLQLPNTDSTTFPVGAAATAKLIWDPTVGKYMVSVAGAAYVPLSTVS